MNDEPAPEVQVYVTAFQHRLDNACRLYQQAATIIAAHGVHRDYRLLAERPPLLKRARLLLCHHIRPWQSSRVEDRTEQPQSRGGKAPLVSQNKEATHE